MITASLPVYGPTTTGGQRLVGVVGVDVLTEELSEKYTGTDDILAAIISNSANQCSVSTSNACDLEDLRGDDAKCAALVLNATSNCTSSSETLVACANIVTGAP